MTNQPTVADYIVRRLAREGITDCFGVAGDFAFKLCDAVARSEAIRWIGCSNELGAAYAADGYDPDQSMINDTGKSISRRKPGLSRQPFNAFKQAPSSMWYPVLHIIFTAVTLPSRPT